MKHLLGAFLIFSAAFLFAETKVVCTTLPVTAVTKAVLNGLPEYEITVLLPSIAGCPHDYSLTPADVKRLSGAQIIVVNGGGMEGFLDGVIGRICPGAKIVDASKGILPPTHDHTAKEEHCDHDDHDHHGCGHHHEHRHNEHILASPAMTERAVSSIGAQFLHLTKSPEERAAIENNVKTFSGELKKIAREYEDFARSVPPSEKRVLVQHSIFDYLAKEAGFDVKGSIFLHDMQEPSASEAAKLIRMIRKERISAIFAEPDKRSRMTDMIAREGRIPVIYLQANVTSDDPGDMLRMFRNDLQTLRKAVRAK